MLLDFPLPLALYKKLLGQPAGLRDLEDMQPMLGRSLRQLLQYEGPESVEDVFCLTFSLEMDYFGSRRTVELKPGGGPGLCEAAAAWLWCCGVQGGAQARWVPVGALCGYGAAVCGWCPLLHVHAACCSLFHPLLHLCR